MLFELEIASDKTLNVKKSQFNICLKLTKVKYKNFKIE